MSNPSLDSYNQLLKKLLKHLRIKQVIIIERVEFWPKIVSIIWYKIRPSCTCSRRHYID